MCKITSNYNKKSLRIVVIVPVFLPRRGGLEYYSYYLFSTLKKRLRNAEVLVITSLNYNSLHPSLIFKNLYNIKIVYVTLSQRLLLGLFQSIFITSKIIKILKKYNPNIIHYISFYPHIFLIFYYFLSIVSKLHGNILNAWTPIYSPLRLKTYKNIIKQFLGRIFDSIIFKLITQYVKIIIALTDDENSYYKQLLKSKARDIILTIIPEGVNITSLNRNVCNNYLAKLKVEPLSYYVIIGRVTPRKRIEDAIYALKNIRALSAKSMERIRLVVIGPQYDTNYYNKLLNLIKKLKLDEQIIFCGAVSEDFKRCLIAYSLGVVHTSEYESFVRTALEAWAYKRPIICYDYGAPSSFIKKAKGGIVVPYLNTEALSKALLKLILKSDYRESLGANGHNYLKRRYTWQIIASKLLKTYVSALKKLKL